MNDTAKTLNELIEIFGFGCEFTLEDLYNHLNNPKEAIESLEKHDLIEKNQVSDRYYLSDIFTCTSFLSEHLIEEETKEEIIPEVVKYSYSIKRDNLVEFMARFRGFEEKVEKIEIESCDDAFEISLEIHEDEELIELLK